MLVTSKTPFIDLHGEISSMVEVLVNEFINDNIHMKNKVIIIIHGKSTNILKNEVLTSSLLLEDSYFSYSLKNSSMAGRWPGSGATFCSSTT